MILFCSVFFAAAFLAQSALATVPTIVEIENFFNGFRTAGTTFTQINDDGSVTTGQLLIRRPGRARFEYDHDETLVIIGGGQVAIFDPVSNQPPEQYPLRRTPLWHILAPQVDLSQSGMVRDFRINATEAFLTLQDPDNPEYGAITLIFSGNPVSLVRWVTENELGEQTTVVLDALEKGVEIGASRFNIPFEIERRGLN